MYGQVAEGCGWLVIGGYVLLDRVWLFVNESKLRGYSQPLKLGPDILTVFVIIGIGVADL